MSGRWKRICLLTATAALAVAAAASLASAKTDKGAGAGAAAATNLSIMGFGPNGAFDDQQFLAAVAARDVPDLVYFGRDKIGTYAARGALVPLTSCIKSHKISTKQYRKDALSEVTY